MRNNKKIIIIALISFVFGVGSKAVAQNISGKVVTSDGKPCSGAVVSNKKNPSKRVITDKTGIFTLQAEDGDYIDIETYNYNKKTIAIGSKAIDVVIDKLSAPVHAGYGNLSNIFESAISTASADEKSILQSNSLSTDGVLFGKILGLTALQKPGLPWESKSNLYIRGIASLQSNSLMVLVDGFERPLNSVNKEEIASITVLKDAAALAMFGLRGSNGVMLVNTKRGKYNSTEIQLSYEHGSTQIKERPGFVNAFDYATGMNEAYRYDGSSTVIYSQQQLDAYKNGTLPQFYPSVDWFGEIFKNAGQTNNYNLSIKGGGQNVRYFTNININDESGFIKPASTTPAMSSQIKFSNLNVRTNLDIKVTPTTDLEIKLLGKIYEYNRPGLWSSHNVMDAIYNTPAGTFPIKQINGEWGGHELWKINPMATISSTGFSQIHSRTLFADMTLKQDFSNFISGLTGDIRIAFDNSADYSNSQTKEYRVQKVQLLLNPDGSPLDTVFSNVIGQNTTIGSSSGLNTQWRRINLFGRLNYERTLQKSILKSSLIFMQEKINNNGQNQTFNRQNFISNTNLGIDNRYFIDATFTLSGSNRLAPGNRYGFFPAVSGAWIVSEESFMKSENLNLLKIRASWGICGSDYTPEAELYRQTFNSGGTYYFSDTYVGAGGIREGRLATLGLTYEKSYKTNIAIEGLIFNELNFTAEAFIDQRRDILVSTNGINSSILGASSNYENKGKVDNKGIEVGLNYEKKIGNLLLSVGGMFTFSRNKIIDMAEGPVPYDYLRQTNLPINQIFGYKAVGFFRDNAEIAAAPVHRFSAVMPGDIRFEDQNNDNIINELDRVALGYNSTCPEIYFSGTISAEFKGLGVSALIQGTGNYSAVLNTKGLYRPLTDNANISQYYFENRWTEEKAAAGITSLFPRLSMLKNDNNSVTSSVWIADRSYIKLRNLEIYYNLPEKWLMPVKLKNVRFYIRANDLFTMDKIAGADAESLGISYPMQRSVNFGANIGF